MQITHYETSKAYPLISPAVPFRPVKILKDCSRNHRLSKSSQHSTPHNNEPENPFSLRKCLFLSRQTSIKFLGLSGKTEINICSLHSIQYMSMFSASLHDTITQSLLSQRLSNSVAPLLTSPIQKFLKVRKADLPLFNSIKLQRQRFGNLLERRSVRSDCLMSAQDNNVRPNKTFKIPAGLWNLCGSRYKENKNF